MGHEEHYEKGDEEGMRKFLSSMVVVISMFGIMTGIWAIDISVSAMNMGGVVTNGLWVREWVVHYHYGLWIIGLAFMSIVGVCLYNIHRDEK